MSEHTDKYDGLIAQMGGLDQFWDMIPVGVDKIRAALDNGDEHLNTIPLHVWDRAAGYDYRNMNIHLPNIPQEGWIKGMSLAERVCTLKRAAVRIAQGELVSPN